MITATGIGRFVKDPVLEQVANTHVCKFTLAVEEFVRSKGATESKKYTNFFDFVAWDKAAELIAERKKKGDQLFFQATPRQDKWQDKETGQNRSKIVFRLDEFRFISSGAPVSAPANVTVPANDDDIPF
jgi:single-strand DNA-binding protein